MSSKVVMQVTKMQNIQSSTVCKLALLVLFNNVCSLQVHAIIRGFEAQAGQFPHQVAIVLRERYICGGGIIGENYVITAAHCVIYPFGEFRDGPMQIVAGFTDVNNIDDWRRVEVYVDKVYVPNRYGGSRHVGDIAVIRTKHPLQLQKNNLQALYLARQTDETYADETAVVAGIGMDEIMSTYGPGNQVKENGTKSGLLSWAYMKVLNFNECKHRAYYFVPDSHLCARMSQPGLLPCGICAGDSGGPLVHATRMIIGVAIASPPACDESYFPGLYTRITAYLGFIDDALNDTVRDMRTKVYESEPTMEYEIRCMEKSCQLMDEKYDVVNDTN